MECQSNHSVTLLNSLFVAKFLRQSVLFSLAIRSFRIVLTTILVLSSIELGYAQQKKDGAQKSELKKREQQNKITEAQVHQAILDLASDSFDIREEAAIRIRKYGVRAIKLLEKERLRADLESQLLIRELLEEFKWEDLVQRIRQFVEEDDPSVEYDLPMSRQWLEHIGDDKKSRALYGEIVVKEISLFAEVQSKSDKGQKQLTDHLDKARSEIQLQDNDILAAVFLGCVNEFEFDRTSELRVYNLLISYNIANVIQGSKNRKTYKKLISKWLKDNAENDKMSHYLMGVAKKHELFDHAIKTARKILTSKSQSTYYLQQSMAIVIQHGSAKDIPTIEAIFKDTRPIFQSREKQKICDYALAAAIHLHAKNPSEFGLKLGNSLDSYNYVNELTDQQRKTAFEKYEAFKANKK